MLDQILLNESEKRVNILLQTVIHHSQNLEKQLNGLAIDYDIMILRIVMLIGILKLLSLQTVVVTVRDMVIMILDGFEQMSRIFVCI
jgi:hypothetical protein